MDIYRRLLLICGAIIIALLGANVFATLQVRKELQEMNIRADVERREAINQLLNRSGLPEIR